MQIKPTNACQSLHAYFIIVGNIHLIEMFYTFIVSSEPFTSFFKHFKTALRITTAIDLLKWIGFNIVHLV